MTPVLCSSEGWADSAATPKQVALHHHHELPPLPLLLPTYSPTSTSCPCSTRCHQWRHLLPSYLLVCSRFPLPSLTSLLVPTAHRPSLAKAEAAGDRAFGTAAALADVMSEPAAGGNELAEVLWENGVALRRAPSFFPPFACSAAGTSGRGAAQQEGVKRGGPAATMRDLLAVQDDVEAVPWLHCPVVGGDGCDDVTAPLPPECCSGLLSDLAVAGRSAGGAPSTSHGGVGVPRPPPAPAELAVPKQPARPTGEGVMNFTFFSRPLQRPPGGERATTLSNPVESTVVQQTATNRLRSTPLFSEQRMAWLQPPKGSRTSVAAAPPPPPPPAPPVPIRQTEAAPALTQRLQPEARPPQPPPPLATATTSSVCSDNGDRSQLKRSSSHHHHYHQPAEWSGSQDEDLDDDDPSALRRSAGRSTKRGRTAEVHNMSERRRRDRINEKMRALQELIPNCNKIDKASMLEEAIEYLKTLQLQVQMMSMGTPGLCVPPMLHLQMQSPMAHFHHHHHLGAMGALAAGFGMGAGAFDPRVVAAAAAAAAAQFPCPMMPPGAPMFGMPVPSPPPPAPPFPPHMANVAMNNNAATAAAQDEQAPPSNHPPQAPAVPRPM